MMKIAFVHDWIVFEWWAESVFRDLIESHNYDEWKIFVLFSIYKNLTIDKNGSQKALDIVTALPVRLNNIFVYFNTKNIPLFSWLCNYRNLMFWFPILCWMLRKKIELYTPNNVVISSFAAAKNVVRQVSSNWKKTKSQYSNIDIFKKNDHSRPVSTTLYLHSPMQYIRENYEENIKKLSFPIKQLYQFATLYLRPRDKNPREYNTIYANSNYTAALAKKLYNIDAQVSYPHIDKAFFAEPIDQQPKPYLVFVWRVQKYVREIGLVIDACNQTNTPLVVIWDGPDMAYAKSIAWPTIIFVWDIRDVQEKIQLIKNASWLINLAKESFGIGTAEALCLWVPVLWHNQWATLELLDTTNWVLIEKDKVIEGIERFFSTQFDRNLIASSARKKFFW